MNRILFSEKMKLADLIHANYKLLYVLPCFGIELGFGESTVRQVCEKKGIAIPLFLLVCNVYTYEDYLPEPSVPEQIPLNELMAYLRSSHKDYLEVRMAQIIAKVLDLISCCHVKHGEMLEQFCEKYRAEIIIHFEYEEKVVFPYIANLLKGNKSSDYTIEEYEGNHTNLDSALSDLKNIIIKYLPHDCPIKKSRGILIDLFLFEDDLRRHTLLEDKILISLVERIEKGIR